MSDELKPCPFCGDVPHIEQLELPKGVIGHTITHMCHVRVSVGNAGETAQHAIAAWNTRAGGWQPIETAPKDGRRLILFLPVLNASVPGYWNYENGQWQDWGDEYDIKRSPSHWMPLPSPPEVNHGR